MLALADLEGGADCVCEGVHGADQAVGGGVRWGTAMLRGGTVDAAPVGRAVEVGRVLVAYDWMAVGEVAELAVAGRD